MFAARLAGPGGHAQDVARAVRASAAVGSPRTAADFLLDGWTASFINGCAAATPTLQEALRKFADAEVTPEQLHLLWLATITAPVIWDDARWEVLSRRHVELARSSGALSELPLALNSRSYILLFRGELGTASSLIEEAQVAIEATRAGPTSWGAIAPPCCAGAYQTLLRPSSSRAPMQFSAARG
jgi:hypothetical protein